MIELSRFEVRSFDVDHLDLLWEIKATEEDLGLYRVTIERSESPQGPFETLVSGLQDTFRFRDNSIKSFHRWRTYYYRLTYSHQITGESVVFGPEWRRDRLCLEALEVSRLFQLKLQEYTGQLCWLLKRRTTGQICGCKDKLVGRRIESNCATCWGTTWVGGYYHPIQIYAQINPTPISAPIGAPGPQVNNNTQAFVGVYPPVSPQDVLIDAQNVRWRVDQVAPGGVRLGAHTRQELGIHEVNPSDIIYKIPLNLDEFSFEENPPREMTLPSSV